MITQYHISSLTEINVPFSFKDFGNFTHNFLTVSCLAKCSKIEKGTFIFFPSLRFKNYQFKLLFVIVLLSTIFSCKEDPINPLAFGEIQGVVTDTEGIPISNVKVTTSPATEVLITDNDGSFTFENVEIGAYTLRAESEDFVTKLESITVKANQTSQLTFILQDKISNNTPPSRAFNPSPAHNEEEIGLEVTLKWSTNDPDPNDDLLFDVVLFDANMENDSFIAQDQRDSMLVLSQLNFDSKYYWQVITKDGVNEPVYGEIWSFRTKAFPNHRFLLAKEENGKFDVYSSDGAEEMVKLTRNNGSNYRPRLSPNRSRIAFISNLGAETHIYIMDRNGTNARKLTQLPIAANNTLELDFAWSPNSEKILYMNYNKLYTINIDGTGLKRIATAPNGQNFTGCDWTAMNNRIAVRTTGPNVYDNEIYLLDESGNYIKQLVSNSIGRTGNPTFSIDGMSILYTKDISGYQSTNDGRQLNAHVFLLNINSLSKIDLSLNKSNGTNDLEPRFSPTGAEVIFTNTPNDGISPRTIFKMNIDGSNRVVLFNEASMPDWK